MLRVRSVFGPALSAIFDCIVGGVPVCYVDCNDNLHFADLQSALDRFEQQHQRSHSQDRALTPGNRLPQSMFGP